MNIEAYKPSEEELFAAENSLTPKQKQASLIREEGFRLGEKSAKENIAGEPSHPEFSSEIQKLLRQPAKDITFRTTRSHTVFFNYIETSNIKTVEDVIRNGKRNFMVAKNVGRIAGMELDEWLKNHSLNWEMFN
jgi:DNA-directed RNA polymerase alpha subunit